MGDVILKEKPTKAWTPDIKNKPLYCTIGYNVVGYDSVATALHTFASQTETLDASLEDSTVGQRADAVLKVVPRPYATASLYHATDGNLTWTEEGKLSLPDSDHTFDYSGCMVYTNVELAKSSQKNLSLLQLIVQSLYNRNVAVWILDSTPVTLMYIILKPGEVANVVGKIVDSIETARIVFWDYDDNDLDSNVYTDSTGQYGYMVGNGHVRLTLDNFSDVSLTAIAVSGGIVVGGSLIGADAIQKLVSKVPGVDDAMAQIAGVMGVAAKDVLVAYCAGWAAAIADNRIALGDVLDVELHSRVIQAALPAIVGGAAASTIAQLAAQVSGSNWLGNIGSLGVGTGLAIIVHGILSLAERWTYVYTHESA
jgi:hypothetical protein